MRQPGSGVADSRRRRPGRVPLSRRDRVDDRGARSVACLATAARGRGGGNSRVRVRQPRRADILLQLAKPNPFTDRQRLILHRMRPPVHVHPVTQRAFICAELASDLGDRTRRLDHHLHSLVTKLGRETLLRSWHLSPPVRSILPQRDPVRKPRGTPHLTQPPQHEHPTSTATRTPPDDQGPRKLTPTKSADPTRPQNDPPQPIDHLRWTARIHGFRLKVFETGDLAEMEALVAEDVEI